MVAKSSVYKLCADFFDRYFHDEESIILLIMLAIGTLLILWLGSVLAPLFTAIVIAYLMQGLVNILLRFGASVTAAAASSAPNRLPCRRRRLRFAERRKPYTGERRDSFLASQRLHRARL